MAMGDPHHEAVHRIVKRLPSDFEPWGERSRENGWGPGCSCGCRWFIPLEQGLRYDWGVCHNPKSPRCGLLTFEHQGCREFEEETDRGLDLETLEREEQPARPLEVVLLSILQVLAVGAIDEAHRRASFSNTGTRISVMAPGNNILSTVPRHTYPERPESGYASWPGTSMATPHAACWLNSRSTVCAPRGCSRGRRARCCSGSTCWTCLTRG